MAYLVMDGFGFETEQRISFGGEERKGPGNYSRVGQIPQCSETLTVTTALIKLSSAAKQESNKVRRFTDTQES